MSWIKIEHGLCKSRKIAKLSAAMKWPRHQAIGFMVDFWIWAAQSCDDGQLTGITFRGLRANRRRVSVADALGGIEP